MPNVYLAPKPVSFKEGFSKKGISEGLSNIKAAIAPAAVAAAAPVVAASGLLSSLIGISKPSIGLAAKKAASAGGSYALQHPIKSLGIIGSGVVVAGAIKENPKLASQLPSATGKALSDLGQTIGKTSKSQSFSEAFGHLVDYTKEHPIASIGGALLVGGAAAKSIFPAIATTRQTAAINKQTEIIQGLGSQSMPSMASPSYIEPATTTTSWEQSELTTTKKSYPAKRKAKNINTRPINIRNYNILANKNG